MFKVMMIALATNTSSNISAAIPYVSACIYVYSDSMKKSTFSKNNTGP
jgi:hypothetical protein